MTSKSSLEPFVCVIPLKPTDDPLKEEQVQKMKGQLTDEYAVRYLESIGAAPTPYNIKRVKNEIPLGRFKLTAAFKSRGGLEDMFYLSNVEPKNEARHLWRAYAARSLFADIVDKKLAPQTAEQVANEKKNKEKKGWSGKEPHKSLPQIATMPAASRPPPLSPSRRDDVSARVALARLCSGKTPPETRRSVRSRRGRRDQINAPELDDEEPHHGPKETLLSVSMDDVLSIQTMFTRTFPISHVQDRLGPEDLALLIGELTGLPMAQLVMNLCELCEWVIVHEGEPEPPHRLALSNAELEKGVKVSSGLEKLLLEIFEGWVEMQGRITKRSIMVLAYPIYLMLLRVGVETVLRNAMPSIFKDPSEEIGVLERIDSTVSSLLDPDGYLNYPPPAPPGKTFIESLNPRKATGKEGLSAAFGSVTNKPWQPLTGGGRKPHPSARFHTVSPMVRNLFSAAESPELRILKNRILKAKGSRAEVAEQHSEEKVTGEIRGGSDPVTEKLTVDNVNKIYLLALKKRQLRREMLEKQRPRILAESDKQTQEEKEDEILHSILPIGVEYMNKRTHAT